MKTFRRSILAVLMAFSLFGLVACDDGGVEEDAGNGGVVEEGVENGAGEELPTEESLE